MDKSWGWSLRRGPSKTNTVICVGVGESSQMQDEPSQWESPITPPHTHSPATFIAAKEKEKKKKNWAKQTSGSLRGGSWTDPNKQSRRMQEAARVSFRRSNLMLMPPVSQGVPRTNVPLNNSFFLSSFRIHTINLIQFPAVDWRCVSWIKFN